jgi:hypothetical protein
MKPPESIWKTAFSEEFSGKINLFFFALLERGSILPSGTYVLFIHFGLFAHINSRKRGYVELP